MFESKILSQFIKKCFFIYFPSFTRKFGFDVSFNSNTYSIDLDFFIFISKMF